MKLIVGKYSGFCNGVNYTVRKAEELLKSNSIIYSLGEIVHNEVIVNDLKKRGLIVKENINEVPDNSKLIIRAHGEKMETYQKGREKNIEIYDLTCGKVNLIHKKILSKPDYFIIIIGKKIHPETIAHATYSNNSSVIEEMDDIKRAYEQFKLSILNNVYVVAQTTFNQNKFDLLCDEIKKVFLDVEIIIDNTICNATSLRQKETSELAKITNKMIIVGGKNSSNTKELQVIASKYCKNVYLIQTKDDLVNIIFNEDDIVGIMGGASTPDFLIQDVINYLQAVKKNIQ